MQEIENTAAVLDRVAMSVIFMHGGWGKLLAPAAPARFRCPCLSASDAP
jgi:hypothetical protein